MLPLFFAEEVTSVDVVTIPEQYLDNFYFSVTDISSDGSLVVGSYSLPNPYGSGLYRTYFVCQDNILTILNDFDYIESLQVSADGSTIVGTIQRSDTENEAFSLRNGILTALGFLSGESSSQATAVSADGSVVVGLSGAQIVRWVDGIIENPGVPYEQYSSDYYNPMVSDDGKVVVGTVRTTGSFVECFRWENDIVTLSGVLPEMTITRAHAMSTDGSTVVGEGVVAGGNGSSFRWKDGFLEPLTPVSGWTGLSGTVWDVSGDGSVVVGRRPDGVPPTSPFRWENGVFIDLPAPVGTGFLPYTQARNVSNDGSIVSGILNHDWEGTGDGVFWSADFSWRLIHLDQYLDAAGFDREGHHIEESVISKDGTTLVGVGRHENSVRLYRIPTTLDVPSWAGYLITSETMDVNTGDLMGWINVQHQDYIWSYQMNRWVYCPEEHVSQSGAWMFVPGN